MTAHKSSEIENDCGGAYLNISDPLWVMNCGAGVVANTQGERGSLKTLWQEL